tara:strand:+ start:234 stop:1157 length:924 start_codon:yes stop_codon:yes gene_type:complete
MRISKTQLLRIIKEEVLVLLEQDTGDSVEDTGADAFDNQDLTSIEERINNLWDDAKEEVIEYISSPDYQRRISESGYVSDFGQFVQDVAGAINKAELTVSDISTHRDAKIIYFDQANTYEDQLQVIPRVIAFAESMFELSEEEILEALTHEIGHIEATLLNYLSPGRGAFADELIRITLDGDDIAAATQNRFDQQSREGRTLWANFVTQYRRKLDPRNGMLAVEEMRLRVRELRHVLSQLGKSMNDALRDGSRKSFNDLVSDYGSQGADLLISIDYGTSPDLVRLSNLADTIDAVASADRESLQTVV